MTANFLQTGASGGQYTFYVYERHPKIIKGQMGGYIYTKIDQDNTWQPIYVGQGDIGVRCTENQHQIECIDSKGATHVHLKLTADAATPAQMLFVDLSSDNDLARRTITRSGSYGLFKPRSHTRLGQMLRDYYFVAQIL